DPEAFGRDLRQRDVGPGDVHLAGEHAQRSVRVEAGGGAGRRLAWNPATQRQPGPAQALAVPATPGGPLRPALPDRVLAGAAEDLGGAVVRPGLAVRHRVALSLDV